MDPGKSHAVEDGRNNARLFQLSWASGGGWKAHPGSSLNDRQDEPS